MEFSKLSLNFQPDLDPSGQGVIIGGQGFIPTAAGIAGAPGYDNPGVDAVSGTVSGFCALVRPTDATRVYVGSVNALYEVSGTTLVDVSGSCGGTTAYTNVTMWSFAQFGDVSIIASPETKLAYATAATGATAYVVTSGTAPYAKYVAVVDKFVVCGAHKDNAQTMIPDGLWWSALGLYDNWAPSVATQCAKVRLQSVPGAITALRSFGTQIFVGKKNGCYLGSYVGGNTIWDFPELPVADGPVSNEACIFIGSPEQPMLFFVGYNDFYLFTGAQMRPVGGGVRQWFYRNVNTAQMRKCVCVHDSIRQLVYTFFPVAVDNYCSVGLVYNYGSNRWGKVTGVVYGATTYTFSNQPTYDEWAQSYEDAGKTYGTMPQRGATYAVAFGPTDSLPLPAIIASDNTIQFLNGEASAGVIDIGYFGDGLQNFLIDTVRVTWITEPDTASMSFAVGADPGASFETTGSATMSNNRFDKLSLGKWHQMSISAYGDFSLNKLQVRGTPAGEM